MLPSMILTFVAGLLTGLTGSSSSLDSSLESSEELSLTGGCLATFLLCGLTGDF